MKVILTLLLSAGIYLRAGTRQQKKKHKEEVRNINLFGSLNAAPTAREGAFGRARARIFSSHSQ
jgi:hypothetical protein